MLYINFTLFFQAFDKAGLFVELVNVSSGASFVKSICMSTTNWCLSSVGLVGCLSSPYITPSKTVKMSKKFENITKGMINI